MFIDSGKVISTQRKEPPFITTKKELKKYVTKEEWTKKELGLLILDRCSNNTQLLTNGGASSKRFVLFKLFLPKSKRKNSAFWLTNLP